MPNEQLDKPNNHILRKMFIESIERSIANCEFEEALEYSNQAICILGDDDGILKEKAVILNILGDHRDAKKVYDQLLSKQQDRADYYYGMGLSNYFSGDFGQAKENLESALAIAPDFVRASSLLGHLASV